MLHHLHDLNPWLPACVVLAALSSAALLPRWMQTAHRLGWTGPDLHKADRRPVADQGGVPVLAAWALGLCAYLAVRTFAFDGRALNPAIWAALGTVALCAAIGVVDDALGWKRGLRQHHKALLCALASAPLWVGASVNPLWAALLITLCANGFNIIAGYNGLEAGQGVLLLLGLAGLTVHTPWVTVLCGLMIAALLPFAWFNRWPARVFPGNGLTYAVGGLIGAVLVLGEVRGFTPAVLCAPYLLQIGLKARGRFKVESFAALQPDGTLRNRQPGWFGVEHLAVAAWGARATERRVVATVWLAQSVCVGGAWALA